MKKFIVISFLFLFINSTYGQTLIGESHMTIGPSSFQEYSQVSGMAKTNLPNGGIKSIPASTKFTIVGETANSYIVYLWNWDTSNANYANLNFDAATNEVRYYLIPKLSINNVSEKIYKKYSPYLGTLSFPFRYRPTDKTFEKNFSLSLCGGVKFNPWYTDEHTFSLLLGVGASSVTLNKYNTDAASNITDPSDRAAVTISLSLMYEWENLQIGISSGVDNLFDNKIEKWTYQGKPWFTVGVGVAIFTKSEIKHPGTN